MTRPIAESPAGALAHRPWPWPINWRNFPISNFNLKLSNIALQELAGRGGWLAASEARCPNSYRTLMLVTEHGSAQSGWRTAGRSVVTRYSSSTLSLVGVLVVVVSLNSESGERIPVHIDDYLRCSGLCARLHGCSDRNEQLIICF